MTEADPWRVHFAGRPFGAVFALPRTYADNRWRIRGSGVHTRPDDAPATAAVLAVCEALGIPTAVAYSGGPCSADAFPVEAPFLDGGVSGKTGNYFWADRGVDVSGPRAVLLLALSLGLRVRPSWIDRHGLLGVRLDDLVAELSREQRRRARAGRKEPTPSISGFIFEWPGGLLWPRRT